MAAPNDASAPADTNHLDLNGDVVLVVSPPEEPRAYNRYENTLSNKHDSALGGQHLPLAHYPPYGFGLGQQSNSENKQETQSPATQRFKVSSKHLTLASKYFEGRLKSYWSEGETLRNKGTVELDITDTNPEALLILLNVIHGHVRRVPRAVELSQLTELAVLVDYFQCHEVVELFSNLWVNALRRQVPNERTNSVVRWMFISWVFRDAEIFRNVTKTAQRTACGEMDTLELPIPGALKNNIDESRTHALEALISGLFSQLGALLKQMKDKGLEPRQSSPFPGTSFNSLTQAISQFKSPMCVKFGRDYRREYYATGDAQHVVVGKHVQDEIYRKTQYLLGLDLQEYP